MKRLCALWIPILVTLFLSGCGGGGGAKSSYSGGGATTTAPALSAISVTAASTSMNVGSSLQLSAVGTYTDSSTATVSSQATWQSSDTSIATVSSAGLVSGVKAGKATITATVGSISGTLSLTVNATTATQLSSISVTAPSTMPAAGTTEQLSATGTYIDNSTANVTSQVTWTSSDPTVATVSTSGLLSALKAGPVVITATIGTVSSTISITVSTSALSTLSVTAPSTTPVAGTTERLTATGTYADHSTADLSSRVTWTSSNKLVATIDASGMLTGLKEGAVTITATLGSISNSISINVARVSLMSIGVNVPSSTPIVGSTEQLTATGTYNNSTTSDITTQVVWASSDASIASVDYLGRLTALKAGKVTLSATVGTISGTASLTVQPPTLSSITVTGRSSSLPPNSTEQLTAIASYSDGSTSDVTSQATWTSTDSTIAEVTATGLLSTHKTGSVTVKAAFGSISGSMPIVVSGAGLTSITITPSAVSIGIGQTQQLTAQGVFTDGTTQDVTAQVTWSSSSSNASISASGVVTGVSTGSASITATLGTISGSASISVTTAQLTSIAVSPATASIATGQTQQFAANGIFSDGSSVDVSTSVTWSVASKNLATIDASGLAKGTSSGTTQIIATSGSVSGSASLTISSAVLQSIDIAPDAQTIPVGGQIQLTVTGTYTDGSSQAITNATWSSSDPTIASVDPNTGIVIGVSSSNNAITITASVGAVKNTTTVLVTPAVPESITLSPVTESIASGTTLQYTVNAIYSDGSVQPVLSGLSWSSSPASVASISQSGLATALATGNALITANYGSLSTSANLTVTGATLGSIVVSPSSSTIGIGGNVQFTATGVYSDNSTQDLTSQVVWGSSASSVALIGSTGLASGLGNGTTTISAQFGGVSGSTTLTVSSATLLSIVVTPSTAIVPPRSRIQLTATGIFSDGTQLPLSGLTWSTSSAKIAMVSNGIVRTKKASSTAVTISARLNGIVGTATLKVTSMSLSSLQLTPDTSTMAPGTTQQFKLVGTFSDGATTVDLTRSATWQTSDYSKAVVTRSGLVSAIASGQVTITASYGSLTPAQSSLTVSSATIQSVVITPIAPTLSVGSSQQFAATGIFSDGSSQDISTVVQWNSSNPSVAILSTTGLATSVTNGQTTIEASFNGVAGTTLLTVK